MGTVNVVLTRERRWENMSWDDYFIVTNVEDESDAAIERVLRDVVASYLATHAGEQSIEDSSRDFNWGDVMMDIPDDFWNGNGIEVAGGVVDFVPGTIVYLVVNQDELLFED